jgi:hypothetical protein
MQGLSVSVNLSDAVYADNKLVPVKKRLPVGSGTLTIGKDSAVLLVQSHCTDMNSYTRTLIH